MPFITRVDIAALARPKEQVEASPVLGGDLLLRELMRAEFNAIRREARAAALRDDPQAGPNAINVDAWNVGLFCTGVLDPNSPESDRKPMFARDEVMAWANRDVLWDEVVRVATAVLNLSEVGQDALKSGNP